MDLDSARERWISEEPLYKRFTADIQNLLSKELNGSGVFARVSGRAKELDSLLKKLLRKPELDYDSMTDKAGARIVVRFRDEIPIVCSLLEKLFQIVKKEDKTSALDISEFGYQGMHYDVKLLAQADCPAEFSNLLAEIQVRTLSQDLWSEMAHELGYKPEFDVPSSLQRRLYCLSALLEVADMEFFRISEEYDSLPDADSYRILNSLEKLFFKFVGARYDKELSLETIKALAPLYSAELLRRLRHHLDEFSTNNQSKISFLFEEYSKIQHRPLFMFQPEIFMIFDLLSTDKFTLAEKWSQHFPPNELEKLAVIWGTPLADGVA